MSENKNKQYLTPPYYTSNDFANVLKFMKVTSNSAQCKKAQKNKKLVFKKKSVENADLYKPVLNKIVQLFNCCKFWCIIN